MNENSYFTCLLKWSLSSAVGVVTRLRPSRRRNCASIYSSTKPSDRLWGQRIVLLIGTGACSPVVKRPRREDDYSPHFFMFCWPCISI